MPSRRAFTIIELILVILIIGAMMSMALFRLDGIFPDTRLRQASARAADMMELASVQAAIEGVPLELVFLRDKRWMALQRLDSEDEDFEREEDRYLYWVDWNAKVEIDTLLVDDIDGDPVSADSIVFLPEGSSDGAILRWRDETGLTQELELWPLLAEVKIKPVDNSAAF